MRQLHIHEVLNIIYSSDRIFTTEELKEEIITSFGQDISFTSCSEEEFSIDGMIDFMLMRGKIQLEGNRIYPFGKACNH